MMTITNSFYFVFGNVQNCALSLNLWSYIYVSRPLCLTHFLLLLNHHPSFWTWNRLYYFYQACIMTMIANQNLPLEMLYCRKMMTLKKYK